jgi:hypothetical protein
MGRMTRTHPPAGSSRNPADPWRLARRIGAQLATWSAVSLVAAALIRGRPPSLPAGDAAVTLRAVALQFACGGPSTVRSRRSASAIAARRLARGEGGDPAATRAFAARLQRLLRLNAGLDVLYVAAGIA